jgi:hypothetical protein
MNTQLTSAPTWSTASFGDTVETSPMDLSVLGDHLGRCQPASARWFRLHCLAERMNGFVASRFVTTLVVAAFIMAGGAWLF